MVNVPELAFFSNRLDKKEPKNSVALFVQAKYDTRAKLSAPRVRRHCEMRKRDNLLADAVIAIAQMLQQLPVLIPGFDGEAILIGIDTEAACLYVPVRAWSAYSKHWVSICFSTFEIEKVFLKKKI